MRKQVAASILAGSAAVLAIGLGITSVLASISPAVQPTGPRVRSAGSAVTFAFAATAAAATMKDGSASVTCSAQGSTQASTAIATLRTGTGNHLGTVANITFGNCTGPVGETTVTPEGEPYPLMVDSETSSTGHTDVIISQVDFKVAMTDCTFTVTGSALGYFAASQHTLTMMPTLTIKPTVGAELTISNVTGCLGVVKAGDHPTYSSPYTLTPET